MAASNNQPHVPERRRRQDHPVPGGQRGDDPSPAVVHSAEFWAAQLIRNRGRIIAVVSVLGPLVGSAFGYLVSVWQFGGRVDNLEAVTTQQTTDIRGLRSDVTEIKLNDRLKTYLLCSITNQLDAGTPKECDDYLSARIPLRAPTPTTKPTAK